LSLTIFKPLSLFKTPFSRVLHSPQQEKFSSSKIHSSDRKKTMLSSCSLQQPPRHDWLNDCNTQIYWKLCLCAKRHTFNSVDWISHYSQSNSPPSTLKLEWSFTPNQPTYVWYADSPSICSPLLLVGVYQNLKIATDLNLKRDCYHFSLSSFFLEVPLIWLDHTQIHNILDHPIHHHPHDIMLLILTWPGQQSL